MKIALAVTGALTLLVFLFPGLIIIGMFLLVLPGLVLMAMPTVFLYLLATWLLRLLLPVQNDWVGYPIAAVGAVALASLAALPLRLAAEDEFAKAVQPEIQPDAPIALSGNVLIEQQLGDDFGNKLLCEALCLALLDLDAVESVTVKRGEASTTFALVTMAPFPEYPLPEAPAPREPGRIITIAGQSKDYRVTNQAQDSLEREWQARLSGPQRLVMLNQFEAEADWHLLEEWGKLSRVYSITGPDGEAKLRRVSVTHHIPAVPPYIGFTAGSAGSGFAGRGFILGGTERKQESTFESARAEEVFARALVLKDYWAAHVPTDSDQPE